MTFSCIDIVFDKESIAVINAVRIDYSELTK